MTTKDSMEPFLYQFHKLIFLQYVPIFLSAAILLVHSVSFAIKYQPFYENKKHLYLIM